MSTKPMPTTTVGFRWTLEVVRGRDVGKHYAVDPGENLAGNALGGARGFDLAEQEQNSPRRMAARQAAFVATGDSLVIRDLESPGGTFVNRQRLLSGQERRLEPDDMIQLGGVQLRVKRENEAPAPHRANSSTAAAPRAHSEPLPPPLPVSPSAGPRNDGRPGMMAIPYTLAGGAVCRSWDDFLTLAAQRWALVRDEIASGRLAEHLRKIQRTDLLPRPDSSQNADERLDAWLERLPSVRSSAPELEVHPETLVVRLATIGGTVRQTLRITNVGYRLLRSRARVEGDEKARIRIPAEFRDQSFLTVDQTEMPVEIDLPEALSVSSPGVVVIESNGGTKRIEVKIERPARANEVPEFAAEFPRADSAAWRHAFAARLAGVSLIRRVLFAAGLMFAVRALVLVVGFIPVGVAGASRVEPRLGAIALLCAAIGLVIGAMRASRAGHWNDAAPAGFAGGLAGVFVGAFLSALLKSIESLLGSWVTSAVAVLLLWPLLGAGIALLSWLVLPARTAPRTSEFTP
jgi:FHA domain